MKFINRYKIILGNDEMVGGLKRSGEIVKKFHYLHRDRTMARLCYFLMEEQIYGLSQEKGVIIYSLPMASSKICGYHPMEILEFARLYLFDNIPNLASYFISKTIKRVKKDWMVKYSKLPEPLAIISWSDNTIHSGTIYKAFGFKNVGLTKGTKGGGKWGIKHKDYSHSKTKWLYIFKKCDNRISNSPTFQVGNGGSNPSYRIKIKQQILKDTHSNNASSTQKLKIWGEIQDEYNT